MDHSWRPRPPPPIQGNVCPTCSISHFPFCPPPHPISFNQNPRFQPHNSHSFQRPFFDPFLDHPGLDVNPHRRYDGNTGDRFGDPRHPHRNPSLEYGQSQIGDSGMVNVGYGDGFVPSRYDHGSAGFKRMRVDEIGTGISMDNERRLKLIHDHGVTPQGRTNSVSGMSVDVIRETEGYLQENSIFDRTFGSFDGLERGRLDELIGARNDMTLKLPTNYEMNDFRDPRFSDFDRKGTSFRSEPDFNLHNYGEEQGKLQSYRNEELGQSRYAQGDNYLYPSLQTNGHTGLLAGHSPNVERGRQGQDMATHYNEGGVGQTSHLGDSYSQSASYPTSEFPSENYYHHSFQCLHPSDSLSAKEPQYSHHSGWHRLSASSAPHHEQRSSFTMENCDPMRPNHVIHSHEQLNDRRQSYEVNFPSHDGNQGAVGHRNRPIASHFGSQHFNKQGDYVPIPAGNSTISENMTPMQASRLLNIQPPLPASPPPPLPVDPPGHPLSEPHALSSSPPKTSSSLFPIPTSSTRTVPSSYTPIPEDHSLARPYFHDKSHLNASTGFAAEELQIINRTSSMKYMREGQPFPLISFDKQKVVDACHIFKQPHRATRPDHIVIILRGLPGSGKSYLAKILRDLEVENGGDAPRIHSMDDYFMTEVEKFEESDVSKSSGSVRGKKPVMKKVMEYCYEPEMEEAYRSSMLKAFKKTLDDGVFSFVIVDDRNLRVADFSQFWATAKRSGYEVYLLEATYKDPMGCAARNVHGFTQDDIQKMAKLWEEASSLYLKLDIKSLFQGDDLKESGIQEVDMDTEDGDSAGTPPGSEERNSKITVPPVRDYSPNGSSKDNKKWDAEGGLQREEVKELGRSKWSDDLEDDNAKRTEATKGNLNALSGLIKAYAKEGKSVHWGDKVGNTGFSIGASRKANISLVIGPGAGYNLKSNPLPEENVSTGNTGESKTQSVFQERIRAEHESFRAVFDKRRQRIGGLDLEEE